MPMETFRTIRYSGFRLEFGEIVFTGDYMKA